jgi:hypothetical protein
MQAAIEMAPVARTKAPSPSSWVWVRVKIGIASAPTRLHQLDSIFAIFGAVSGGKPLYFRVWQIENRL